MSDSRTGRNIFDICATIENGLHPYKTQRKLIDSQNTS